MGRQCEQRSIQSCRRQFMGKSENGIASMSLVLYLVAEGLCLFDCSDVVYHPLADGI